jgi:hypothetical protein
MRSRDSIPYTNLRDKLRIEESAALMSIMAETSPAAQPPLRIGTRRSNLAVVQAEGIRDSLQKIAPERSFEIEALRTLGDKDQSTALYNFGAKSLWTAELEDKLTSGQLDVIVHCLKGESAILDICVGERSYNC